MDVLCSVLPSQAFSTWAIASLICRIDLLSASSSAMVRIRMLKLVY